MVSNDFTRRWAWISPIMRPNSNRDPSGLSASTFSAAFASRSLTIGSRSAGARPALLPSRWTEVSADRLSACLAPTSPNTPFLLSLTSGGRPCVANQDLSKLACHRDAGAQGYPLCQRPNPLPDQLPLPRSARTPALVRCSLAVNGLCLTKYAVLPSLVNQYTITVHWLPSYDIFSLSRQRSECAIVKLD